MLSEGSPNVNRPACGKKIRKINKQFLYHRDPMWNFLNFGTVFLTGVKFGKLRKAHCSPPLVC